ncbi:MAG TPA: hypothetical protein VJT31_01405 [Rugosimonospora sp.]|nr:hypothetical protein [Rugosimonospora sp.]
MGYLDPRDPRYNAPQPTGWQPPPPQYPPQGPYQQPGYPPPPPPGYGPPPYAPPGPFGAPPQPAPPKKSTSMVLLICAVAVLAICGAGIAVALVLASTHHGANPATQSSQAASAQPTSTAAIRAAIVAWNNNGGKDKLDALDKDSQALATAAGKTDIAGLKAACSALEADVADAQAYAPIPDAIAQQHWAAALADYGQSAADCVAAADALDATRMTKAGTEMRQGTTEIQVVTARLKVLSG